MKKTKILSVILCAAALTGAFAFSACGTGGNEGANTQNEGENTSNEGENTQNEGENTQNEHVPVTTVADEEEWRNAFDIFSYDSFTVAMVVADGYYDRTMTAAVDVANLISSSESVATNPEDAASVNNKVYFEYANDIFWTWFSVGNQVTYSNVAQGKTAEESFIRTILNDYTILAMLLDYTYYASGNLTDGKPLSGLYSEFSYNDGKYVSDNLKQESEDEENVITITFADGIISECEFQGGTAEQKWEYSIKITDVNSTTVTAPDGAREAIDAEKNGQS